MQQVFLSHTDEEMPMVLITEADKAQLSTHELTKMFKGNQIQIEDK